MGKKGRRGSFYMVKDMMSEVRWRGEKTKRDTKEDRRRDVKKR